MRLGNPLLKCLLLLGLLALPGGTWAQPAPAPTPAAPAGSAAPAQRLADPCALFANENSTGARGICAAEGNCGAGGQRTQHYYGHIDPGNRRFNIGWCSLNSRYHSEARPGNLAGANAACTRSVMAGCRQGVAQLRANGIDPSDPANILALINYVDVHNQSPVMAPIFAEKLRAEGRNGPYNGAVIVRARARACSDPVPGLPACNDAGGQARRAAAINQAVTGQPLSLGALQGDIMAAQMEINLRETVRTLQCWPCNLIGAITNVADEVGEKVFDALNGSLQTLLIAVLGIYLVYTAAKLLLPFGPAMSVAGLFNQVTLVTGTTLLVILLLGAMTFYWEYIYRPVLTGSMTVSQAVLNASDATSNVQSCFTAVPQGESRTLVTETSGQLECMTRRINESLSHGIRIGWAMIVGAEKYTFSMMNPMTYPDGIRILLLVLSGVILMLAFGYASLAFLWVVIDIVYRWTKVSILSPLMMAAWTFPPTRTFATFGVKAMMESFIALILVSIIASMITSLITQVGFGGSAGSLGLLPGGIEAYLTKLQTADNSIQAPTLNQTAFWTLLAIAMLAGSLMFKMREVASYLTGSAAGAWGGDVGQKFSNSLAMAGSAGDQVFGRFGSRLMTGHLKRRYQEKFGRPFVAPKKYRDL